MNADWVDLLVELNAVGARYLVVGAHALGTHGVPRATIDLDLWIDPTPTNAALVWQALAQFGAPLDDLRIVVADLVRPGNVIQVGIPPNRIDLMTAVSGLPDFGAAWERRHTASLGGQPVAVLGREDLLANKRASGRKKDLLDIEALGEA